LIEIEAAASLAHWQGKEGLCARSLGARHSDAIWDHYPDLSVNADWQHFSKKAQPCPAPTVCAEDCVTDATSDMAALVMPSVAARAWQARQRGVALAGWMVWLATFVFATMAGIGFASTNIADVTMVRASRETPAVTAAQTALSDAMMARDRECKGGVGKHCREREQAIVDRRQALDAAMQAVAQTADPQAVAAVKLVSWVTAGAISPSENDFNMLRLMLLCLLPQLAGVLLMVGVRSRPRPPFTTGRRDLRSGSAL
jgi:hypothetical protein